MAALLHPALFYYRVSLLIKNCLVECVVSRETNPVMLFSQNLFKPLLSHLKIMKNKSLEHFSLKSCIASLVSFPCETVSDIQSVGVRLNDSISCLGCVN